MAGIGRPPYQSEIWYGGAIPIPTKFGQLIIVKIIKILAARFWLVLRPRPGCGRLQRSPDPLAGLKGSYFKERGGEREGKGSEGRKREGMEGKGKG